LHKRFKNKIKNLNRVNNDQYKTITVMKSNRNPLKKSKRALKSTVEIKKDLAFLQDIDNQGGEYRNRTDDQSGRSSQLS